MRFHKIMKHLKQVLNQVLNMRFYKSVEQKSSNVELTKCGAFYQLKYTKVV